MGTLYASEAEAALHEAAIESLANEMRRTPNEIKPHYERELERLKKNARVEDFLSVCAARHIRENLRRR